MKKSRLKLYLNFVLLITLGLVVYSARSDIFSVWKSLASLNFLIVLCIIPLQIINYHCYARIYQESFEFVGAKISYPHSYSIALEMNFINNILPSAGASGFGYLGLRAKVYGIELQKSMLVQSFRWLIVFAGYIVVLALGVFLLAFSGTASRFLLLISTALVFVILLAFLISIYLLDDEKRISKFVIYSSRGINRIARFFRPNSHPVVNGYKIRKMNNAVKKLEDDFNMVKKNWKKLLYISRWGILANLTEITTIYVAFLAYSEVVNPGVVIIAYGVAVFAGLLAIMPGGVGVYESLMTGVMASGGIPAALGLSATLLYRIFTMSIFLPIGYFLYYRASKLASKKDASKLNKIVAEADDGLELAAKELKRVGRIVGHHNEYQKPTQLNKKTNFVNQKKILK